MAQSYSESSSLLLTHVTVFRHWLRSAVANCAEGRCKHALYDNHEVIFGAEGSSCDFGVCQSNSGLLSQDIEQRLVDILSSGSKDKNLRAYDVKCTDTNLDLRPGRSTLWYRVGVTGEQVKVCYALVICSPTAPHLVSLLPPCYLAQMGKTARTHGGQDYFSRVASLYSTFVEPFPAEWLPAIRTWQELKVEIRNMSSSANTQNLITHNHYGSFGSETFPQPPLQGHQILRDTTGDLETILTVRSALQTSEKYRVHLHSVTPSIGDFAIRHQTSNSYATVEVKRQHFRILGETLRFLCGKSPGNKKYIFTPFSQWDFLLATSEGRPSFALLIPLNEFPQYWFHEFSLNNDMKVTLAWINQWRIDLDKPQDLHRRLEGILDKQRGEGSSDPFIASSNIAFQRLMPRVNVDEVETDSTKEFAQADVNDSLTDLPYTEGDSDSDIEGDGNVSKPRAWRSRRFEADQHTWLSTVCSEVGWGAVYALGQTHPSATHAFVPGAFEANKPSFFDLHVLTPVVLLNFIEIERLDSRRVHDLRHTWQSVRASHGPSKSFYIFVQREDFLRQPHLSRWLVPSEAMVVPERVEMSELALKHGQHREMYFPYRQALPDIGECVDVYARRGEQIIDTLRALCICSKSERSMLVGDDETQLGTEIEVHQYITSKEKVTFEFLNFVTGQPLWTSQS